MNRLDVLNEINLLMDRKCNGCKTRKVMAKENPNNMIRVDNHCNRKCDVGKQIQELGKQLTK